MSLTYTLQSGTPPFRPRQIAMDPDGSTVLNLDPVEVVYLSSDFASLQNLPGGVTNLNVSQTPNWYLYNSKIYALQPNEAIPWEGSCFAIAISGTPTLAVLEGVFQRSPAPVAPVSVVTGTVTLTGAPINLNIGFANPRTWSSVTIGIAGGNAAGDVVTLYAEQLGSGQTTQLASIAAAALGNFSVSLGGVVTEPGPAGSNVFVNGAAGIELAYTFVFSDS